MASVNVRDASNNHDIRIKPRFGKGSYNSYKASHVVNMRNPCKKKKVINNQSIKVSKKPIKLCTWNVRTMFQAGKINNAIAEMNRFEIDIMGISEIRWSGNGQCSIENHKVYYSGNEENQHIHGVGFIVSCEMQKYVINFVPISERIGVIQLSGNSVNINLVQVYTPTYDADDVEIEQFYCTISDILKTFKKHEMKIIIRDMNAKIGQGKSGDLIGDYGLGVKNERGGRLKIFVENEDLAVLNTFFKLPPRRLYKWRSPRDQSGDIVRNQIDYMFIKKRFRNSCLRVKTYPGADIESNHNHLVGSFRIRFKKCIKNQYKKKWDMRRLEENEKYKKKIIKNIENVCRVLKKENNNVEETFQKSTNALERIGKDNLEINKNKKKKWMTENIANDESKKNIKK
jgi:hypothetical protein